MHCIIFLQEMYALIPIIVVLKPVSDFPSYGMFLTFPVMRSPGSQFPIWRGNLKIIVGNQRIHKVTPKLKLDKVGKVGSRLEDQ